MLSRPRTNDGRRPMSVAAALRNADRPDTRAETLEKDAAKDREDAAMLRGIADSLTETAGWLGLGGGLMPPGPIRIGTVGAVAVAGVGAASANSEAKKKERSAAQKEEEAAAIRRDEQRNRELMERERVREEARQRAIKNDRDREWADRRRDFDPRGDGTYGGRASERSDRMDRIGTIA